MASLAESTRTEVGVTICFEILAWAFVGLRVWARWLRGQKLQLSDYLLFAALLGSLAQCCITVSGAYIGDVPEKDKTMQQEELSRKLTIPGSIFWGVPLFFVKMSILQFYTVVFKVNRWLPPMSRVLAVLISLWIVVYICIVCLGCIPIQKIWDDRVPGACLDTKARVLSQAWINMIFDVLVVLLPMPVIWTLNMSVTRRFLISLIFSSAIGVCVISALRIYWLMRPNKSMPVAYFIFTQVEVDLSVIVACLPLLQPILTKVTTRFDWFNLNSRDSESTARSRSAAAPALGAGEKERDARASERLRNHLWHIPELDSTAALSTRRADLESYITTDVENAEGTHGR